MKITTRFRNLKIPIIAVLLSWLTTGQAATFTWRAPDERENGEPLTKEEICCYELRGFDSLGIQIWNKHLINPRQVRTSVPDIELVGIERFEISVSDTNGLYSEWIEIKPFGLATPGALKLEAPTGLRLD